MSAWVKPDVAAAGFPLGILGKRFDYMMDSQYGLFLYTSNNVVADIGNARFNDIAFLRSGECA